MTLGWQGAPCCHEIRPGAGFKTGDLIKKMFGGLPYNDSREYVAVVQNELPRGRPWLLHILRFGDRLVVRARRRRCRRACPLSVVCGASITSGNH